MQSNLPTVRPLLFPKLTALHGPQTRRLLRRSAAVYAALFGVALALLALAPERWAGFALGLIAPGAGFAAGGAMLASVGLFGLALLIWFATGNVLLPPMVWLGAAWLRWIYIDEATGYATDSAWAVLEKFNDPAKRKELEYERLQIAGEDKAISQVKSDLSKAAGELALAISKKLPQEVIDQKLKELSDIEEKATGITHAQRLSNGSIPKSVKDALQIAGAGSSGVAVPTEGNVSANLGQPSTSDPALNADYEAMLRRFAE